MDLQKQTHKAMTVAVGVSMHYMAAGLGPMCSEEHAGECEFALHSQLDLYTNFTCCKGQQGT